VILVATFLEPPSKYTLLVSTLEMQSEHPLFPTGKSSAKHQLGRLSNLKISHLQLPIKTFPFLHSWDTLMTVLDSRIFVGPIIIPFRLTRAIFNLSSVLSRLDGLISSGKMKNDSEVFFFQNGNGAISFFSLQSR